MRSLNEIQQELSNLVTLGIPDTLKAIKKTLPHSSPKIESIILLEARLNEVNKKRFRGLISNEELQIAYNKLRQDLLDFIKALTEKDLDPNAKSASESPTAKPKTAQKGSVLYRIPEKMPLEKESKCLVRIALDEDKIIENIELDGNVRMESLRVSDFMMVELIDPSSAGPFEIRSLNSAEQFIEIDEYTEWLFYVKPLQAGTFPLVLKVSVIELINGKERKREIVLEEHVEIITEGPVEEIAGPLKAAEGYSFSFFAVAGAVPIQQNLNTGESNAPTSPESPQPVPAAKGGLGLSSIATALIALAVIAAGIWALTQSKGIPEKENISDSINAPDSLKSYDQIPQDTTAIKEAPANPKIEPQLAENPKPVQVNEKTNEPAPAEEIKPEPEPTTYKKYPTVIMANGQTWLGNNLDDEVPDSWCYDNNPANCEKFGRLYTWEAAKKQCAKLGTGWRLPNEKEWTKVKTDLNKRMSGGGLDDSKEAVLNDIETLLTGYRDAGGNYINLGKTGYFWRSSDNNLPNYTAFYSSKKNKPKDLEMEKPLGLTCRCIRD